MTRQKILNIFLTLLIVLVCILVFKTYELKQENISLQNLLIKTITPIDLANWEMHGDFDGIRRLDFEKENPDLKRRSEYVDSLYKLYRFNPDIDSGEIINLVRHKILLNDSFQKYFGSYPICRDGEITMITNEFLYHSDQYHYGDTVTFVFHLNQHLMGNSYEIVDFDHKDIAQLKYNTITYTIPTKQLLRESDLPKEIKFRYKIKIRSTYTNKLDTIDYWKTFTVYR